MIIALIFATLLVNIIILYFVYDLLKQQSKIVDKDDFTEYAKITKEKYTQMQEDVKDIANVIRVIKISITAEQEDRKNILSKIAEIQEKTQELNNLKLENTNLKVALIRTKQKLKRRKDVHNNKTTK